MACVHHQDYGKLPPNNHTHLEFVEFAQFSEFAEFAYKGALLLKKERMEIITPDYPKHPLLKKPKIEPDEDTKQSKEPENEICSSYISNIDPNSQKRFENTGTINSALEKKRKRVESDATMNAIIECRLAKGQAVGPHVQKLIGFFQSLEKLGSPFSQELAIGIVLGTLSDEYCSFIRSFYRGDFDKTLDQLHQMLTSFEINIRKDNTITKPEKTTNKCKGKGDDPQIQNLHPKSASKSHDLCNYCNELGHWKRNCRKYLMDLKKKGGGGLNLR